MKNKKIIIIFCVVAIILILISIFIATRNKPTLKEYKEIKEIRVCKSEDCEINDPYYIHLFDEKTKYEEVNTELKKINEKSSNYFEKIKKGNMDSAECKNVKNKYYYPEIIENNSSFVEDNKYVSAYVTRVNQNLCTNTNESLGTDFFVYDVNKKKILTQEELKNQENITDEIINKTIEKSLEYYDEDFTLADVSDINIVYGESYTEEGKNVLKVSYFNNVINMYDSYPVK